MTRDTRRPASETRLFWIVTAMAVALVVMKALSHGAQPLDRLVTSDNDDILRLLSVRDWLAGQGWFDMVQPRMVPPDGLDLHWSRYVDLGIAALIWPLSLILPMQAAEGVALVAWPTLLLIGLIVATGLTAKRLCGPMAGLAAVQAVVLWPVTGSAYFAAVRVDHHNVQILLTTFMLFALLLPGRPWRAGIAAGLAAALSLAVGLEMLLCVALAGLVLAVEAAWLRAGAGNRLLGFAATITLAGAALFAGQVPFADWALMQCDELSLAYLAVAAAGTLIVAVFVPLAPRVPHPALRLAVLAGLAAAALLALHPWIAACYAGPYGSLPADVHALITTRIVEARPALPALAEGDSMAVRFVLPAMATLLAGLGLLLWGGLTGAARRAVVILTLFTALGVLGSLSQIRLVVMGAAAIPMLMGLAIAACLAARQARPKAWQPTAALVATVAGVLLSPALAGLVQPGPAEASAPARFINADTCREKAVLETLNAVPRGVILGTSNYGAPILLLTDHAVLAGPYHRSPEAIRNGALPFDGDEATLRRALDQTGADYLLLCRQGLYGTKDSFASALAQGMPADSLRDVAGVHGSLRLLAVD